MSFCQPEQRLLDAIRATIAYADVFDFPLGVEEIHRDLLGVCATPEATGRELPRSWRAAR